MEEAGDSSLSQSLTFYSPLRRAVLKDDWKAAEAFIQKNPNCLGAPITKGKGTALHHATAAKRTRFVKELVKLMTVKELELKTEGNYTALYFAAQSEIVTIAEEMVKKNKNLPSIFPKNRIDALPLYAAIQTGNRDMVSYLHSVTPIEGLDPLDRIELLIGSISTDLYDTALKILDTLKTLKSEEKEFLWFPLEILAKKPSEIIGNKSQPSVWERCLNSCFRGRFCNKAMMQASAHQLVDRLWKQFGEANFSPTVADNHRLLLVEAAKVGNVEFLIIFIRSYPDLIWQDDAEYRTLFHVAIEHRQERVFNLIYEIGVLNGNLASFYAEEGNKMLQFLADKYPTQDRLNIVSGAALQMQRELLWFQDIGKIVPMSSSKSQEKDKKEAKAARDKFVESHVQLRKNGEKWMKVTANSCMLVAALITTVVFPAAFTVPGGNNQESGIPIFLESNWYTIFFLSNVTAMLFSSSSILIFLSILMASYSEKDFIISLPRRLALGLITLLISIVCMFMSFTAACSLMFEGKNITVSISIILAAPAIPISLFVMLPHSLWLDIYCSAFCSKRFLFGSQNRLFKQAR